MLLLVYRTLPPILPLHPQPIFVTALTPVVTLVLVVLLILAIRLVVSLTLSLAVDSVPVIVALISLVFLEAQALQDDNHLVLLRFP